MSELEAIVRWYASLTLVAVALFPFVAWLGDRLGPARYGLLRPLSLVTLTAVVWWPAAAFGLPFSRWTLLAALIIVGAVGWALFIRHRVPVSNWQAIVAFETLWLMVFALYVWFRGFQPDIINTEKPMEIALLSSVSRSTEVPAPDPWFAGSAINYYYFGYQTFATAIKISGVPSAVAFNLSLATLFASGATVAAAAGAGLLRALGGSVRAVSAAAGLAVVLLLFAGNLETTKRLIDEPSVTIDAGWWDGVGWQASRIIVDTDVTQPGDTSETINEFPAFSFVLGDLHPHVLTYPLLAIVLVLALGTATSATRESWLRLASIGALVGLLYASNSWDAPAGLLLVSGAIALGHRFAWKPFARDVLIVSGAAIVAAAPFVLQFTAPVGVPNSAVPGWLSNLPLIGRVFNTFAIVTWRPSSVSELLTVHGAWLLAFAGFAAVELVRDRSPLDILRRRQQLWLAGGILTIGVAMAWVPALIVLGVPLALAGALASRSDRQPVRVVAGTFAVGFLLALIPEFIYIQDVFSDRMNTVFKLFYQAWLVLSVASAAALVYTVVSIPRMYRIPAFLAALVLVVMTLPYTPLSAQDWTDDFADRRGIDGRDYLARSSPDTLAAIEWVSNHAQTGDTIVETPGCSYANAHGAPLSRVSAFTGVPTLVGWHGHESQWRRGEDQSIYERLDQRVAQANAVLDGSIQAGDSDVRFVILGDQEIEGATNCDLAQPRSMNQADILRAAGWAIAFEAGTMTILAQPDDPIVAQSR